MLSVAHLAPKEKQTRAVNGCFSKWGPWPPALGVSCGVRFQDRAVKVMTVRAALIKFILLSLGLQLL